MKSALKSTQFCLNQGTPSAVIRSKPCTRNYAANDMLPSFLSQEIRQSVLQPIVCHESRRGKELGVSKHTEEETKQKRKRKEEEVGFHISSTAPPKTHLKHLAPTNLRRHFLSNHGRSHPHPSKTSPQMEPASDLLQRLRPTSSTASMSSSSSSMGHFRKHSPGIPPPHPQLPPPSPPLAGAATLPPRKAHRRSQSDVSFGLGFVKQESDLGRNAANVIDSCDDLFTAYMNLDSLETLNSSGIEDKRENMDSHDSSENEAESSVNENPSMEKKEGTKRSAPGDLIPANSRHCRSISMDSFMGKLNFADKSPKLPPLCSDSMDGEFTAAEMKKIMANEKLAEMALADPKRVKRILANRQSAARSKERKTRYISELEHKVQILQTEATTLSAQFTLLQRDSAGLANQNNELKFRLQAMEQQAHLRDALSEALTAEVQRLRVATGEISEDHLSNGLNQQALLNSQMYHMQQLQLQQQQQKQQPQQQQHQQSANTSPHQMQSQQQQTQPNNCNGKREKN